ncbi:MAG: IRE (iron responsive element) [Planctomycetota bacterium]|nr:IRE (iron responsive element) [Planctomycetota bacterium]
MNRTSILGRKIIYLLVLLAMLFPLYLLGQPAGGKNNLGGRLSEMRHQYNIAESDLGEISPASETMKLASLGLRGVAATLLWNRAHRYRVEHEWDRLKATLNNIALLQPHFDKVWEHQAHNLAYNVSTEFDDYRQRYEMVREGTEFLTRGVRQNTNAPRLVWYTGWFYGAKLGMSDEKTQFRKLFADDEVLHESLMNENIAVDSPEARGPLGKPDNWLVGRLWLNHGYDLVDTGVKIRRQTPLNFYETGPKWRFKHAEAIEREGILDESAQNAWRMASEDWEAFGNRSIPTTSPFTIKLGQIEVLNEQRAEKIAQFRELNKEAFDAERQRLIDELPVGIQEFWQKPLAEMTYEQRQVMPNVQAAIQPDISKLAPKSDPSVRLEAVNLVGEVDELSLRINKTEGYRTQINYDYWETLALAEQEKRTVTARRLIYEAEKANADAELDEAIKLYEQAFVIWAEILDAYPVLVIDDSAEDLFESVRRYMIAIDSQELPEDFPLREFAELMGEYGRMNALQYEQVRAMRSRNDSVEQSEETPNALMFDPSSADSSDGDQPGATMPKKSDSGDAGKADATMPESPEAPGPSEAPDPSEAPELKVEATSPDTTN